MAGQTENGFAPAKPGMAVRAERENFFVYFISEDTKRRRLCYNQGVYQPSKP
jgi:hypothetical protein